MNSLETIGVNVDSFTGNVQPLLYEIRHALCRLAEGGDGTVIDMRGLPLAPGEEDQIEAELGEGEIVAELDAMGPTTILETTYPGVWIVTHRDAEREVVGKFIEVTHCPHILKAQDRDIADGISRLDKHLLGDADKKTELIATDKHDKQVST